MNQKFLLITLEWNHMFVQQMHYSDEEYDPSENEVLSIF